MNNSQKLQDWVLLLQNHKDLQHHSQLPEIELKLERIQQFLHHIGDPHLNIAPTIHIAGTNGKGSSLAFLHAIIKSAQLKAHRYTSPHLVRFNERFIVANEQISDAELLEALDDFAPYLQTHPLTYFEATTALAFWLFARSPADYTLLEVGMGGRFDATNVIPNPALTAITPVSLDHTEFLGDNIAKIAFEKAGIIKAQVPCVVGVQHADAMHVITARANELNAPLFRHAMEWDFQILPDKSLVYHSERLNIATPPPALWGEHQYQNAALAIACVDALNDKRLTQKSIQTGMATATWQGRLQPISLTHHGIFANIIVDGGHNAAGAEAISAWLMAQPKKPHLIMGLKADKDASALIAKLAPHAASLCFVPIADIACYAPHELVKIAKSCGFAATAYAHILEAANATTTHMASDDIILITGSLYLVGEVIKLSENSNAHKISV